MRIYSRNLLIFLALAGCALLSTLLARDPVVPPTREARTEPERQGFYMLDAELLGTNDEGHIFYRVFADRFGRESDDEDFGLTGVRVKYAPDSDIHWELTATSGRMPEDRSYLDVSDVLLVIRSERQSDDVAIETGALHLDAERQIASTDEPVIFRKGRSETMAAGLRVDLEAKTYELEPKVTMHFLR